MNRIYLASMGHLDADILEDLEEALTMHFGFETRRHPPIAEPEHAYDPQRRQFSAVAFLQQAVEHCPPEAVKMLTITERDLFIPMLSFVYGQAQLGGKVAVVSLAQLRQEFYGFPSDGDLLRERALKEMSHEMGHTFGLIHCPERLCIMSLSTNIRHIDLKGSEFCGGCRAVLRENTAVTRAGGSEVLAWEERL
ncbi:MAG: archaemetzincin family Zn-dependent metalloprotease [Acidobacteriia bacterium]|nr:archaemetzincin family Zn-dependent metalloprotease [Terriglobia bacterium]